MYERLNENRVWYRRWLEDVKMDNPYALTLTMKQRFNNIPTTVYEAQKNMGNFITRLSRMVLGNNYRRRRKRLTVLPSYETKSRQHYHVAIDFPEDLEHRKVYSSIVNSWKHTPLGMKEHEIKPIDNHNGWISYITKLENLNDTVDVVNMHINK